MLVIASGANRVDLAKVDLAKIADGRWLRDTTGFAIGGVSPIGHANGLCTFIDVNLLALDLVWAAAGSPRHVYHTSPAKLVRMTGGEAADVKEDA